MSFADVVWFIHRRGALGLELRQLQFLPQPVDDLVDLQLDDEPDLAVAGAAGAALLVALIARRLQHVARLSFALAGALLRLRLGKAKTRVLEELDRDRDGAVAGPLWDRARQEIRQAFLHRRAHFLVVAQPVARAARARTTASRRRCECS